MSIETLQGNYIAALDRRIALEHQAWGNPEPAIIEDLFAARRDEDEQKAELQKAIWLEINEIDTEIAA
jgi:hypothetical protein